MRIVFHPKFDNDSFMEWIDDNLPEMTSRGIIFTFKIANSMEIDKFIKKKPKDEAVVLFKGKTSIVGTDDIEEFIRKHPKIKKAPKKQTEEDLSMDFRGNMFMDIDENGNVDKNKHINIMEMLIHQDKKEGFQQEEENTQDESNSLKKQWEERQKKTENPREEKNETRKQEQHVAVANASSVSKNKQFNFYEEDGDDDGGPGFNNNYNAPLDDTDDADEAIKEQTRRLMMEF